MSPESISLFPGLELCHDVGPAEWVRAALRPWTHDPSVRISSFVPAAYPAHGRILHRTESWRPSRLANGKPESYNRLRWREIAEQTGRTLDARTRYSDLLGWYAKPNSQSPPSPWGLPSEGTLQPEECAAAAEVLSRFTTTPNECWFCLWEGYGRWPWMEALAAHTPRVRLENRDCLLFRGPVAAATAFRCETMLQSPTLWWPEDRAWFVATDLDEYSTYLGASPEALQSLIVHPDLEVLECAADQPMDPSPWLPAP